jgi:GNAT superfamily N-acetyltransferase
LTGTDTLTRLALREPAESELPICRMLLPEACANPIGRHFRIAHLGESLTLVGALSYRDDGTAVGGVRVHVLPQHRRTGIGSRLLEAVEEEARRFGRGRITADVDLHNEPAAEPFLTSSGFQKLGTITFAEIGLEDLRASMQAGGERMKSGRNALPASFRFVELSEAPMAEITRLYAEHIAHMQALAGWRQTLQIDRATDSIALLIDNKLAGFVLARVDNGVLYIPAWVIAPEHRGHHIGFALLSELAGRVRGRVERLRFEFTDVAFVTARMLNVPGCQVTKIAARFAKAVAV